MMPASRVRLLILAVVLVGTAALPLAQAKKALSIDDYPKWRSISGQSLSADGGWVAYTLQFTNTAESDTKPVLHLRNLSSGQDVTVPHGTGAQFSPDAKWLAYTVDPTGGGRGGHQHQHRHHQQGTDIQHHLPHVLSFSVLTLATIC